MVDTETIDEPAAWAADQAKILHTPCGDGQMVWRSWGSGPDLVLLHGGTGSWRHWARNVLHLSQTHRVLAPDLPGLGQSALPPEPYTPMSVAAIVGAGLDELLGAGARYDLTGFSFGALVSSQLSVQHRERLRTLTLVGPNSLGMKRAQVQLEKVRSREGDARREANRTNLGIFMFADPSRIDDAAIEIQDWNTRHARLRSKGFAEGTYLRDAIAVAPTRVGVIWGDGDVTAWPSVQARVDVVRAARPDADVRVIPDAGHWVAYEAAEAFDTMLLDMIGPVQA
jgi:pimeloyl-ACP methyl ester carboxylesterase